MSNRARHWNASGFGAWRHICLRVVLDANMVNYSPIAEIDALRARGYLLSVSLEGLREIWTRSLNEDSYEILSARIRKLASRLNEEEPIAFAGRALLASIGSCSADDARAGALFRDSVESGWRAICKDGLSRSDWKRIGAEMKAEVDDEEQWWLGRLEGFRALEAKVKRSDREAAAYGGLPYDRVRAAAKIRRQMVLGAPVRTIPAFDERADAHFSYLLFKLWKSLVEKGAGNDYFDGRHLQHLAWPSFLATVDYRLVATVDEASRRQRAWVRTPVELVQDPIVRCAPWGKPGAFVAGSFVRRRDFRARQERWRADLKTGVQSEYGEA